MEEKLILVSEGPPSQLFSGEDDQDTSFEVVPVPKISHILPANQEHQQPFPEKPRIQTSKERRNQRPDKYETLTPTLDGSRQLIPSPSTHPSTKTPKFEAFSPNQLTGHLPDTTPSQKEYPDLRKSIQQPNLVVIDAANVKIGSKNSQEPEYQRPNRTSSFRVYRTANRD